MRKRVGDGRPLLVESLHWLTKKTSLQSEVFFVLDSA
jgi:hypothetical protein